MFFLRNILSVFSYIMKPIVTKVLFLTEVDAASSAEEEICYSIVVKPERVSRALMTQESM